MAGGLPPPPTRAASGDFAWTAWNNELYKLLSTQGAVAWDQVNKAGSSIADLQNKNHNLLTPIQGGAANDYFHLTQDQHDLLTNLPWIETIDTATTSISLTSTPQLLKPPTTVTSGGGVTYDASTGVFTFPDTVNYSLVISVNATATAANQFVYIYAETDSGSGWAVNANSGKSFELVNASTVQIVYSNAVHRIAGQKVRYWIYSNSNKVSLGTSTLPGGVGVKVPAIRIQYAA